MPRPTTTSVADHAPVRVTFPEHDFDGYWVFGGLSGCERFGAVKFGVTIGAFAGYDWGLRDVPSDDPGHCLYDCVLVGADERVQLSAGGIRRHELTIDGDALGVELGDRFSLRGPWPRTHWRFADGEVELELEVDAGPALSLPQMIQNRSQWTSFVCPSAGYQGTLRIGGEQWDVTGWGCFDHPMGRLVERAGVPGVGYWQWNGYAVGDEHALWEWKIVDGAGDVIFSRGATTFPDGDLRVGALELEYTRFERIGALPCPVEWRSQLQLEDTTLAYGVRALGDVRSEPSLERGEALPNLLLEVDGDGMRGLGTGETTICRRDPETNDRQEPW